MGLRIRLLASVAAVSLSVASACGAATPNPATDAASVEEVVVTGSSIHGVAPVGSVLMTIGRDQVEASGATSIGQLLQTVPQVVNLGVSESSRAQNGGSANFSYAQGINIHGIGPYATLLLVDGRRLAPQGSVGQFFDVSVIPTIALQRMEILPDGASAIYGSDAVAGVANLILRRHFEGVETQARYGLADNYHQQQASLLLGRDWGSGHGMLAYSYDAHTALNASNRSFAVANLTARGGSNFQGTNCNPGNILISGVSYAIPAGGVTPATASALSAGTSNRCNVFANADLLPKAAHNNLVATVDQDVTSALSLTATAFASQRTDDIRASVSTSTISAPTTNAFYTRPTAGAAPETIAYAFSQIPSNNGHAIAEYYQGTVGAKLKLPDGWRSEGDLTYTGTHDYFKRFHALNAAALATALASNNPATAFNPYGGVTSPAVLASISNGVSSFEGRTNQFVGDLTADGPIYQLPGGTARLAVGYQHQMTLLRNWNYTGSTIAPVRTQALDFTRYVDSAFAELLIPIVGPGNAVPGVQSLDLDVAGRYDNYSDAGSTRNPKIGVNWTPVDGVKAHASYGTSFRAPSVYSAHSAATSQITTVVDPQAGGAPVTALQISGGNTGLQPEVATTYSAGVDYKPSFVRNLTLSATFFDIKYTNILSSFANNPQVLTEPLYQNLGIVIRNPTAAQVSQTLATYRLLSGVVPATLPLIIDGRTRNLGGVKARGIDFIVTYDIPTERAGDFTLGFDGSYFANYQTASAPGDTYIERSGTIFNPLTFQGRGTLNWRKDDWSAQVAVNYADSYDNNLATAAVQRVSAYTTLDLHLAYDVKSWIPGNFTRSFKVALDVTNVFDTKPPFVNIAPSTTAGGGYDATLANPVGRIVAVGFLADF